MKVFESGHLSEPVYLGIDQSYSGFAMTLLSATGYKTTVYKSEYRGVRRLDDIRQHMVDLLSSGIKIEDVAMEGYAFGSQMANMLGELGGLVKLTLLDFLMFPAIIPPTVLKKYACGVGKGISKSQILLHVYKNFGAEFTDDNAADSYVLAHIVSGMGTRKYEKDIYKKIQDPQYREK